MKENVHVLRKSTQTCLGAKRHAVSSLISDSLEKGCVCASVNMFRGRENGQKGEGQDDTASWRNADVW